MSTHKSLKDLRRKIINALKLKDAEDKVKEVRDELANPGRTPENLKELIELAFSEQGTKTLKAWEAYQSNYTDTSIVILRRIHGTEGGDLSIKDFRGRIEGFDIRNVYITSYATYFYLKKPFNYNLLTPLNYRF